MFHTQRPIAILFFLANTLDLCSLLLPQISFYGIAMTRNYYLGIMQPDTTLEAFVDQFIMMQNIEFSLM